jgi:hypothetical protein
VEDSITWNLATNGEYTTTLAYKKPNSLGALACLWTRQFEMLEHHPRFFFSFLAFQNWLWPADRIEEKGWLNCGICPLCKQTHELSAHLFFQCRYTKRRWRMVGEWLAIVSVPIIELSAGISIDTWWTNMPSKIIPNGKDMSSSLCSLASWTIWDGRNARIFHNKFSYHRR